MSAAAWANTCQDPAGSEPGRSRGPADRDLLGRGGEDIAARYLEASGCLVLERRWRSVKTQTGEIDLIVREGDEIVFVEVKTRRSSTFGFPEEAVTAGKRQQLRRTAAGYLSEHGLGRRPWRIDVIAILAPSAGGRTRLRHIRSAVGEAD